MNEETTKYIERIILRQEEILQGSPWKIKDALREFTEKLRAAIEKDHE